MKAVAGVLAVLALMSGTTLGRKTYMVKEAHARRIPKVRATTYPKEILYENNDDDVIVYYQAKMTAGWEWKQTMTEN